MPRNKRSRSKEGDGAAKIPTGVITNDGDMPKKKFYRARAHCNPLSFNETFEYPVRPELMDWTELHYPEHPASKKERGKDSGEKNIFATFPCASASVHPDVLDVGCGFGGLTLALAPALPDRTILGLEIRAKVAEYVRLRIVANRKENPGRYDNCSVMRTNAMKYLPNFFAKASLQKIFFCFPDPHFKRKNHPRRIISERLLTEYAYLLKPGSGRLYCITDVKDLHDWHIEKCGAHPSLVELSEEEMDADPCVALMKTETEEGSKVSRIGTFGHDMYYKVYQRVNDEVGSVTAEFFFGQGQFGVKTVEK